MRLEDFGKFVPSVTAMIRHTASEVAERLELPVRYLESSRLSKEDVARAFRAERPMISGPICLPLPCSRRSSRAGDAR